MMAHNCKAVLNGAYGTQVEKVIQVENKMCILWALYVHIYLEYLLGYWRFLMFLYFREVSGHLSFQ